MTRAVPSSTSRGPRIRWVACEGVPVACVGVTVACVGVTVACVGVTVACDAVTVAMFSGVDFQV